MNSLELNQELARLRSELEKQEMQHKELASQLSSRHAAELSALNEQLIEADNMRATYEIESALPKEKVEQSRQESAVENESKCGELTKTTENKRTTEQLLLEDTQRRILTQKRTDFIAMQKYFLSKQRKTNNNFINQYKSLDFLNLNKFSFSKRELWEVKQQRELARELVRKDS